MMASAEARPQRGSLVGDLGSLLESGEASDICLQVSDSLLPAHRAILTARSPVFGAMLRHSMQESLSGTITITDLEEEIVKQLLCFMYTDEVPLLDTVAAQLLPAAEIYDLPLLKRLCEEKLAEDMIVENAAARAVLAVTHSCVKLKEKIIEFIRSNQEVLATTGWENAMVSYPRNITEICRLMIAEISEKSTEAPAAKKLRTQTPRLADDMAGLLATGQGADMALEVGNSEGVRQLLVHRAVLVARCPALASVLRVEDVGEQALRQILLYLYTGQVTVTGDLVWEVLVAAKRYFLPELAKRCEKCLVERLSIETAMITAVLADIHARPSLRRVCVEFIRRHIPQVMGTDGWKTALQQHSKAAAQICSLVSAAAAVVVPRISTESERGEEEECLQKRLHKAAGTGNVQQVLALLGAGVSVSVADSEGCTALHWAAGSGHLETVRWLLHMGANAHAKDDAGDTPLAIAASYGQATVVKLLVAASTDVNIRSEDGSTALHLAAQQGHLETAAALIDSGANKAIRDNNGRTPMDVAKLKNRQLLIDILK